MGILPKSFRNLPQDWSLCTWPPRVPRPSRDTRADRDTWRVWGSPGQAGTRATRVFSSWLLITHRTLYKTHLSTLTLLVTHFTRVQLLSRGDIFSNNSDYQVLTGCPCPVIITCRYFPGWMLSGRALRPHWALDPGPGSGLLISPRPRPQSRLIILNSNVILS